MPTKKTARGSKNRINPATLEILWGRLIAISEEQAAMVLRTAFSTVVRESNDFACVLLTRTGDLLAQPYQSLPGFTRCTSVVMKHFLSLWQDWHPGDVAITNDPWLAAGHLYDLAVAVPVFHKGKLIAFAANFAHQADIGGRGFSADAASIFEEGLAVPPMKLYKKGKVVEEVLSIIAQNVRVPDQVMGDVQAQIGAARLAARRTSELLTEMDLEDLDEIAGEILSRSEASMRAAIRAVPNGVYFNEGVLDGFDAPLLIKVKLTVKDDELEYDFEGTSPQINKGINSCFNFSYSYASFAAKALLNPMVPNNEGSYLPIRMKAPEGSIVHSKFPAPGNSRSRVGHMIVPIVFGAFEKALPGTVPAESGSPAPRLNFFGSLDNGSEFQCMLITSGGFGAQGYRDGLSCMPFPTNSKMASLEMTESITPLRFLKRELVPDSGGDGQYRGGLGQEIAVQILGKKNIYVATSVERIQSPPLGYHGGSHGAAAAIYLNNGDYIAPKARTMLKPLDVVTVRTPGGGGFGKRKKRSPKSVKWDFEQGYTTDVAEKPCSTGIAK